MNPSRQRIRDARDRAIERLRRAAFRSWLIMFAPYLLVTLAALSVPELQVSLPVYLVLHAAVNVFMIAVCVSLYRARKEALLYDWAYIEPPPSVIEEPDDDTVFDDEEDQAAWALHARDGK